jgi:hypothetical protein
MLTVGERSQILAGGRACGKTTAIIAWAAEDTINRVVLVQDSARAKHLFEKAVAEHPNAGFQRSNFVTPEHASRMRSDVRMGADDAQAILAALIGHSVEFATWSVE